LRYESEAFATGSMITIASLLLGLGALGYLSFRKEKASPTSEI
jgi:hypothetical protein